MPLIKQKGFAVIPVFSLKQLCFSVLFVTFGSMSEAQEYVATSGKLSDDDFYRLVTCAAPPGGECQKKSVRWPEEKARDLTFGVIFVSDGFPKRLQAKIEKGLERSLVEINGAGANLSLRRAKAGESPKILIHLLDIPEGQKISGTGVLQLDGETLGAATNVYSWKGGTDRIVVCHIASSNNAPLGQVVSGILEEMVQCLGFGTDIGGKYYESRSIFSETSNALTRLGKQDIMALRRHYP